MRTPSRQPVSTATSTSAGGIRDAESLFRTKPITEIRAVESATRREIEQKREELRQLVGKSYRDLIDSADSIIQMETSCDSISSNLSRIYTAVCSLSPSSAVPDSPRIPTDPARAKIYGIASRVKYLVDTPENIWGCLDESMLLEASGRYLRAKEVRGILSTISVDPDILSRFPLLQHQWQIVESFKSQISQRSRERLMDLGLTVAAYADALAAAATIDDLDPKQVLDIFLDSRRSWISQKLAGATVEGSPDSTISVLCDVAVIIRATLGQVGQLWLHALNEIPLFYKTVLGSPPGTQLFGRIPNPEEEVKLWKSHRDKLESVMVVLNSEFVSQACSSWLQNCCDDIFAEIPTSKGLLHAISSGEGLMAAEKMIRDALDGIEGLEGSLEEWLRGVFGSDVHSPWKQICGLILKDGKDILEDKMEQAFLLRMKEIVHSGFEDLRREVNISGSVKAIVAGGPNDFSDFLEYLKKSSKGGGVWFSELDQKRTGLFHTFKPATVENDFRCCFNAYFGPEVCRIRDLVDTRLRNIVDDILCFVELHDAASRLKELAPYVQGKCYKTILTILKELEEELDKLSVCLSNYTIVKDSEPPFVIVERSLFLGRILYALRYHSTYISIIFGSPRHWVKEVSFSTYTSLTSPFSTKSKESFNPSISFSPRRPFFDTPSSPGRRRSSFDTPSSPGKHSLGPSRKQAFSAAAALFPADNGTNPKLEGLGRKLHMLCIRTHSLWITWISNEISVMLSRELNNDDALSTASPLQGWEVTVINQDESSEGSVEMQIALPSIPSQYVISFLFQACQEIHKVGGHVLDKVILQNLASKMLRKVVDIYESYLSAVEAQESRISEKGVLQVMLDLKFFADVLSGGQEAISSDDALSHGNKKSYLQPSINVMETVMELIHKFSQRLDPIDWATYEPYLWENEKQSYKRCSVLFGFFIQLNRLYTELVQKLPTKSNTESNVLRCSSVPRFQYLPISAHALSSRVAHKSSIDDTSSRSLWKTYPNGERSQKPDLDLDDSFSFGVATPLLKSLMTQVGSKFGESTSRWGSMLSDGQVGKLKDRSAAAMSTFGDMLPGPAAGLLSFARFDSI